MEQNQNNESGQDASNKSSLNPYQTPKDIAGLYAINELNVLDERMNDLFKTTTNE